MVYSVVILVFLSKGDSTVVGTSRLRDLFDKFEEELGKRQSKARAARPAWEPPKTKLDEDLGKKTMFLFCVLVISVLLFFIKAMLPPSVKVFLSLPRKCLNPATVEMWILTVYVFLAGILVYCMVYTWQ